MGRFALTFPRVDDVCHVLEVVVQGFQLVAGFEKLFGRELVLLLKLVEVLPQCGELFVCGLHACFGLS